MSRFNTVVRKSHLEYVPEKDSQIPRTLYPIRRSTVHEPYLLSKPIPLGKVRRKMLPGERFSPLRTITPVEVVVPLPDFTTSTERKRTWYVSRLSSYNRFRKDHRNKTTGYALNDSGDFYKPPMTLRDDAVQQSLQTGTSNLNSIELEFCSSTVVRSSEPCQSKGNALNCPRGISTPVTTLNCDSELLPVRTINSNSNSVESNCGSITVIGSSEPSLSKEVLEDGSNASTCEANTATSVLLHPKVKRGSQDDRNFTIQSSSIPHDRGKVETEIGNGWKPFPDDDVLQSLGNQMKGSGGSSLGTLSPSSFGVVSRVAPAEEMRSIESSNATYSPVPDSHTSSLPEWNTSISTSASNDNSFTDVQQLQLCAQLFVYGSLIQGTTPDEVLMMSAFGDRDGERSVWENEWRLSLGRPQHPQSPLTCAKVSKQTRRILHADAFSTPVQASGVRAPLMTISPMNWDLEMKPYEEIEEQSDTGVLQQKVRELERMLKKERAESMILQQKVKELEHKLQDREQNKNEKVLRQKNEELEKELTEQEQLLESILQQLLSSKMSRCTPVGGKTRQLEERLLKLGIHDAEMEKAWIPDRAKC